ncbi:MAG: hypothetical protein Kow006_22310 [Gammaproteobacteria bacterium]
MRVTRQSNTVWAVAWLFVTVVGLSGCSTPDEEAAIHELIGEGVARAEAHDLGGLADLVSEGFTADPGGLPWRDAKRLLFVGMKRYGNFRILHPKPSIELEEHGQRAEAVVHFLVVNRDRILPELEGLHEDPGGWLRALDRNADLFTLAMQLSRESGEWRVYRARLTRFAGLQASP